jgi:hypothetical protein
MNPEIARNQNHDDHYANDSKYVHFLDFHFMTTVRGTPAVMHSAAISIKPS